MQVGLDARRVVVKSHGKIGAVEDLHGIVDDRGIIGTDIGWRGDDRPVSAFGLGVTHIVDSSLGIVAAATVKKLHLA